MCAYACIYKINIAIYIFLRACIYTYRKETDRARKKDIQKHHKNVLVQFCTSNIFPSCFMT